MIPRTTTNSIKRDVRGLSAHAARTKKSHRRGSGAPGLIVYPAVAAVFCLPCLWWSRSGDPERFVALRPVRPGNFRSGGNDFARQQTSLELGVAAGLCAFSNMKQALGMVLQHGTIVIWHHNNDGNCNLEQQTALKMDKLFLRPTVWQSYYFQFSVSAYGKNWISCGDAADDKNMETWDCGVLVALTDGGVAGGEGGFVPFPSNRWNNHSQPLCSACAMAW